MTRTVKLSQATWQKVKQVINAEDGGRTTVLPPSLSGTMVRVRNDADMNIPRFGVLGLDGPVFDPATDLAAFCGSIVFKGVRPGTASHSSGRFVVCREPLPMGAVGLAMLAGVIQVKINVGNAAHLFAEVTNNEPLRLTSAESGPCTILWKATGTGEQWAIVRFGAAQGIVGTTRFVSLSDSISHPMSGRIQRWTGSAFTTDAAFPNNVSFYRYPTHTNNDMYKGANPHAGVCVAEGVFVALHAVPRQFELY